MLRDTQEADWSRFRAYLLLLARQQVHGGWGPKLDLSGIVQQTLLEAHRHAEEIAGLALGQQMRWLRTALARNLADELARLRAAKRDARRERSLEEKLNQSSAQLGHWLAAHGLSPSQQVAREEQILALAEAIAALPAAQRFAVEAHYFRGQTVAEIAQTMDKTQAAVAGLLKRALKQLRAIVSPQE